MTVLWNFRCYVSVRGTDEIRAAYNNYPKKAQVKFHSRLKALRTMPRSQWVRPYVGVLFKPCEGLWEIRFNCQGVEHRPLGFFQDATTFVLVFWAIEKGSRFVPLSACGTGLARKEEILAKEERSHACWLAFE